MSRAVPRRVRRSQSPAGRAAAAGAGVGDAAGDPLAVVATPVFVAIETSSFEPWCVCARGGDSALWARPARARPCLSEVRACLDLFIVSWIVCACVGLRLACMRAQLPWRACPAGSVDAAAPPASAPLLVRGRPAHARYMCTCWRRRGAASRAPAAAAARRSGIDCNLCRDAFYSAPVSVPPL
jgi:hypothetical protein